nr:MAG TPA: hypothetical protein [Caudoviricetes sp.]
MSNSWRQCRRNRHVRARRLQLSCTLICTE